MKRFLTAISITASLAILQSVAYAQSASDLMPNASSSGADLSLQSTAGSVELAEQPLLERTLSNSDLLPTAVDARREWHVELFPDFSADSACSTRSDSITIFCFVTGN